MRQSRTRLFRRAQTKNSSIADLQSDRPHNPISEKSKQMIHTLGNVECLELCNISAKVQCLYCLKYWTEGIVDRTCGTCWFTTECTRKVNRERFDALTVPNFVIKKGVRHGSRYGKSEAQREYFQAKDCMRKAKKEIQSFSVSNNARLT